ncbi:MAG: hypothetical protein WC911_01270 [Thermoleophilia bacterium]
MWFAVRGVIMPCVLTLLALMIILPLPHGSGATAQSAWLDDKPVASFLFTNDAVVDLLAEDFGLSAEQKTILREIGIGETAALAQLKQESEAVVDREDLSVDQKQVAISGMDYNSRVSGIVASSRMKTESLFDADQKSRLPEWVSVQMKAQRKTFADAAATAALGPMTTGASGSYRVYATQYYSNFGADSIDVAVPDKYAKFASLGWEYHAGYPAGANYSVNLGYNGHQLNGVRVKDCGPWNIDDNYWNTTGGSRPRRLFAGLATGLPGAQAAYFDDYNGGLDQFGRMVSNPAGIDLSPKAGVQLGLGYLVSGWVTVTFNWENTPVPAPGIPVYGAIRTKYDQLGGAPGQPTNAEHDVAGGRAQDFSSGRITWNRSTGRTHWVLGAIMVKYDQMGGAGGMGLPTTDESDVPGKPGARMTIFERGRIYWSAAGGPHVVIGGILNRYLALGGAASTGLPTTDEYDVPGGRASSFEGGVIYWSPGYGPRLVNGAILARYLAMGGPAGAGLPTSDEYAVSGGRASDFQKGKIFWSAATGSQFMNGAILGRYLAMGGPASLGLPTSDEYATPGGRVSNLQSGRIYWSPESGPHHIRGAIMTKFDQLGGTAGMGFPLTDETSAPGVSGGRMSEFSRGRIYWSPTAGSIAVYGAILAKYKAVGASQTYGLPVAEERDVNGKPGAREGQFERGRIYWSPATGTSQVYGAILARYLLGGGPAGPLGLPVSDEYGIPGGRRTNFQGGYIVWDYFGGGTSVVTNH